MVNRYCFSDNKLNLNITAYTDRTFRITYGEVTTDSVIVTATPENVLFDKLEQFF